MIIGIDARFFGPKSKGLGRYTQKLIENLEKIDQQNQYVIFLRKENWDEYQPKNQNFKKTMADYRWYSLAEQIFMPALIRRQRINLMHFPHFNVPVFYFGKFVVTIHDLILRHFPTRRASTLGFLKYWLKNLAYKIVIWLAIYRAKKIIVPSEYVKKDIVSSFGVVGDNIIVTYEGAPIESTKCKVPRPRLGSAEGGQSAKFNFKTPYLLYVGNAYPHKNLENLIRAFEILVSVFKKDMQLVLVGEKDYFYQRLKNFVCQNFSVAKNRIIFSGFVSDEELSVLYQNAALYIFPSFCEGFGLPPLEAMAHGVPVTSSNTTCLPEVLGSAAVYFDAKNPRDMAGKISEVLKDLVLREKLICAGYEQIKKYSWDKMVRETLQVYRNVVGYR